MINNAIDLIASLVIISTRSSLQSPLGLLAEVVGILATLPCHLCLLICLADEDLVLRSRFCDIHHFPILWLLVLLLIKLNAYAIQVLDHTSPQLTSLFSNTTSKHQSIEFTSHFDVITTYKVQNLVDEQVKGELTFLVALFGLFTDDAKVCGAGDGIPAAFLVENLFGFGDMEVLCAAATGLSSTVCEVENETGVYRA